MGYQQFKCKRCENTYPATDEKCPQCGSSVPGRKAPAAALLLGVVLAIVSLTSIRDLWLFFLLGSALAGGGALLLNERRRATLDP